MQALLIQQKWLILYCYELSTSSILVHRCTYPRMRLIKVDFPLPETPHTANCTTTIWNADVLKMFFKLIMLTSERSALVFIKFHRQLLSPGYFSVTVYVWFSFRSHFSSLHRSSSELLTFINFYQYDFVIFAV